MVEEDQARDRLSQQEKHKPMGLDMFKDMKKQSEFIARLLSVVFERLWPFEDVPDD